MSLGYNDVPTPYTGNVLPLKPDLSGLQEFVNESIVSEPTAKQPVVETNEAKASENMPKVVRKNFIPLLIEYWISDKKNKAESKSKIEKKIVKPSFAKVKECRASRSKDTKHKESTKRTVPVETPVLAALVSCDGLGSYDWSDQAEDSLTKFALMVYSSTSSNSE
nr:hypothetical protein [Tanacetum cinerariifolium]